MIVSLIVVAFIVVVIVLRIYFKRRIKAETVVSVSLESLQVDQELQLLDDTITDVELGELLSSGNFGSVYHGKWQGTEVALKKLKNSDQIEELKKEILILK